MGRREAAKYLGERARRGAIRRAGQAHAQYPSGRAGPALYDEAEVRRLKEEMDGRALPKEPAQSLAYKRELSLDEAVALSGLARELLLHSILAGRLRAQPTASGYSIRCDELHQFARGL